MWNLFKKPKPKTMEPIDIVLSIFDSVKHDRKEEQDAKTQDRWEEILEITSREALREIRSLDFCNAENFIRSFGVALTLAIPIHISELLCTQKGSDKFDELIRKTQRVWLMRSNDLDELINKILQVLMQWREATPTNLRDLGTLISWLHAKASFSDAIDIFPKCDVTNAFESLMTISGNFFPASSRGIALCHECENCVEGDYLRLGGGIRLQGGTYLIAPESPRITTHLWMVNKALAGPPLDINVLDPAGVFFLQILTMNSLTDTMKAYRETAMEF